MRRPTTRFAHFVENSGIPYLPMSMAKGLLPDTHPQSAGAARSLVLKEADVVVMIGARLNWLLSATARASSGAAEPKKFVQIDIEPKEMDSNVEIAAPLVGDIGSCVSALLDGMGEDWQKPPAEWTGDDQRQGRCQCRQDGAAAAEQQCADGLSRRAGRAEARSSRNAPMRSWSTKAPIRSISPARSSTCPSRASGWMSAPGASWASAWARAIAAAVETGQPGAGDRGRQRLRLLRHGGGNHLPLQPAGLHRRLQQQRHLSRHRRESDPAAPMWRRPSSSRMRATT